MNPPFESLYSLLNQNSRLLSYFPLTSTSALSRLSGSHPLSDFPPLPCTRAWCVHNKPFLRRRRVHVLLRRDRRPCLREVPERHSCSSVFIRLHLVLQRDLRRRRCLRVCALPPGDVRDGRRQDDGGNSMPVSDWTPRRSCVRYGHMGLVRGAGDDCRRLVVVVSYSMVRISSIIETRGSRVMRCEHFSCVVLRARKEGKLPNRMARVRQKRVFWGVGAILAERM